MEVHLKPASTPIRAVQTLSDLIRCPMKSAALVFPHQLFRDHPAIGPQTEFVAIIEDSLFFGDHHHPVSFHQQKLWLHRATMRRYHERLTDQSIDLAYIDFQCDQSPLEQAIDKVVEARCKRIQIADPHDNILLRRVKRQCRGRDIELDVVDTPAFINTTPVNREYREGKKRWFMADFYQFQRRRLDILMNGDDPVGDRWSFDEENRKKVPRKMLSEIPTIPEVQRDQIDLEAKKYVLEKFPNNPGSIETLIYPTSHDGAERWLQQFLEQRFRLFGDYEDAIVENQSWLWHSVLTPMLNVGLLTPQQIVEAAILHSINHDIPINSTEGFVRQIIGWREFIRATYEDLHVKMRRTNHWKHTRQIPRSFWDGTTGIDPIDDCIARANQTGYLHHIERLMVIGGFMFLCEFDPDEIYKWFMEMFVDSYDWVMVPNAYAMSQNADGGLITTKPYFSGSSYIKKMSHYRHGPWADTWDGLYWRWIWNHRESLGKNPRWAMMCKMSEKMDDQKRQTHLDNAKAFFSQLDAAEKYYCA